MKKNIILIALLILFFLVTFLPLWQKYTNNVGNIKNGNLERGIQGIVLGMKYEELAKSFDLKEYIQNNINSATYFDLNEYEISGFSNDIDSLFLSFDKKSGELIFIEAKYKAGKISSKKYSETSSAFKKKYGRPKKSLGVMAHIYLWRDPKTQIKIIYAQPTDLAISYENNECKLTAPPTFSDVIGRILSFLFSSLILIFLMFRKESMHFIKLTPERYRDNFLLFTTIFIVVFISLLTSDTEFFKYQKIDIVTILFGMITSIPISILLEKRRFEKIKDNIFDPYKNINKLNVIISLVVALLIFILIFILIIHFNLHAFVVLFGKYFWSLTIGFCPISLIVTFLYILNFEKKHGILYFGKKPADL